MSSVRERMLDGELYDASDPELVVARRRARQLLARYNADPDAVLLRELLGEVGLDAVIEPPFHCDYGENVAVGERFYANVAACSSIAPRSRSETESCSVQASTYMPPRTQSTRRRAAVISNTPVRSRSATTSGSVAPSWSCQA